MYAPPKTPIAQTKAIWMKEKFLGFLILNIEMIWKMSTKRRRTKVVDWTEPRFKLWKIVEKLWLEFDDFCWKSWKIISLSWIYFNGCTFHIECVMIIIKKTEFMDNPTEHSCNFRKGKFFGDSTSLNQDSSKAFNLFSPKFSLADSLSPSHQFPCVFILFSFVAGIRRFSFVVHKKFPVKTDQVSWSSKRFREENLRANDHTNWWIFVRENQPI